MTLAIEILDGGVYVEDSGTEVVAPYPSGTSSILFNKDRLQMNGISVITIKDVSDVSSIDDNTTGGSGSIPVPLTVREIFDILKPFFFKLASSGGETTTASNGLTKVDDDVRLGGTLSASTTIDTDGNDFTVSSTLGGQSFISMIDGADTGNITVGPDEIEIRSKIGSDGTDIIADTSSYLVQLTIADNPVSMRFNASEMLITDDNNSKGLEYNADYSLNYNDRSLIDRGYALTLRGSDLGEFTIAGLPPAGSNKNKYALATDASGGRTIVRSDGTNWKVVAVEGATVTI